MAAKVDYDEIKKVANGSDKEKASKYKPHTQALMEVIAELEATVKKLEASQLGLSLLNTQLTTKCYWLDRENARMGQVMAIVGIYPAR